MRCNDGASGADEGHRKNALSRVQCDWGMGTTDVLVVVAAAALALLALVTLATTRARARVDHKLQLALGQIGQSMTSLSDTMHAVAERSTGQAEPAEPPTARDLGISLALEDVARAVATAASRLPGVDAAAVRVSRENGEQVLVTTGIPADAAEQLAVEPPDAVRWEAAEVRWHRGGTLASPDLIRTGTAVPLTSAGSRLGTLVAFTRAAEGLRPESEVGLVRLAAAATPALVNARRYEATLELVTTDALTGLKNRRAYDEGLRQEIERSRRTRAPLSLLLLDLDDFGSVNKIHSLQVGDAVLTTFASALLRTARAVDVVCRRGGEEFAIVLPDTACTEARLFYARLRHDVALTPFPTIGSLTFSAGLTHLRDDDDAHSLDERASRLLNRSKANGKNTLTDDCQT